MDEENTELDLGAAAEELSSTLFPEEKEEEQVEVKEPAAATPAPPAPAPTAPAPAPADDAPAPAPAAGIPPAPRDITKAPNTWGNGPAKDNFANLDEATRAEIHKREEDMFKGLEEYKGYAGDGKNLHKVLQPHMADLERYGINPFQHIAGLMNAHKTLALGSEDQKLTMLRNVARDYGIDLGKLNPVPADQQPYVDPEVKALRDELNSVKTSLTSNAEAQRRAAEAAQLRTIEAFAKDPAHPHFAAVEERVLQLLHSRACADLKTAYETAVWENPVTRKAEMDRQTAELAAQAAAAEEAKVRAAREAQAANVKASAKHGKMGTAAPAGQSIADTLAETMRSIKARESK